MQKDTCSFFFSDIQGYSSLVGRDENLAFQLLQEHNRIIESSVQKFHGRIVKYIGDSIFANFDIPEHACDAALNIQKHLKKRNELSRNNEKIIVRIGVHMGQAIIKDDDLFGNDSDPVGEIDPDTGLEFE